TAASQRRRRYSFSPADRRPPAPLKKTAQPPGNPAPPPARRGVPTPLRAGCAAATNAQLRREHLAKCPAKRVGSVEASLPDNLAEESRQSHHRGTALNPREF